MFFIVCVFNHKASSHKKLIGLQFELGQRIIMFYERAICSSRIYFIEASIDVWIKNVLCVIVKKINSWKMYWTLKCRRQSIICSISLLRSRKRIISIRYHCSGSSMRKWISFWQSIWLDRIILLLHAVDGFVVYCLQTTYRIEWRPNRLSK